MVPNLFNGVYMTGIIHIYYFILSEPVPNKFSGVFARNVVSGLFYYFSRHLGHRDVRVPRRSVVKVSRLGASGCDERS